MKKVVITLLSLVFAFSLVACGSDSTSGENGNNGGNDNGDAKVIRAGIGLNDSHPQYKALLLFKEIVEEETNGEIVVETFHSGQLGDDRQMIENLQLGSQEVTIPATAPLTSFVPEFSIFSFPYLFENRDIAEAVLDGDAGDMMLEKLEASELVGLSYWEEGYYNISNSVRPINTIDDMDGIKIRVMETDILLDVYESLGMNPTPMAFGEVYTALQQGVVDAQTNPISQIYESKFHEVQDYISGTNEYYGVWVFLMSKEFYDGLTPEQQEIVTKASEEARDYQRDLSRGLEAEYLEKLIDEGANYNEVSPEAVAEMREAIQPVYDEYTKNLDSETVDMIFDAIDEAKNN